MEKVRERWMQAQFKRLSTVGPAHRRSRTEQTRWFVLRHGETACDSREMGDLGGGGEGAQCRARKASLVMRKAVREAAGMR
jgi:hypothetical protein